MKNLQISEINNLVEVSKILAQTPFYAKLGAGGVLAIYLTAMELNLPVMFCLNGGLHNIDGRVSLSGQAINMMLRNAGWKLDFIELSDKACHIKFTDPKDKKVNEFKYTVEEAEKAGYFGIAGLQGTWEQKPKKNWIHFTKDMLFARCIANGGRKFAPEVLGNCYGEGEIDGEEINIPLKKSPIENKNPEFFIKNEPMKIESKSIDDVEQFKKRHKIEQGEKIYDYVINISKDKNLPVDQTLTQCFLNENKFIESFKRYESKFVVKD